MKYFFGARPWAQMKADIDSAGHQEVDSIDQAQVYINTTPDPQEIPKMPANIEFVQHCFTGVNQLIYAGVITDDGVRLCYAAGAFAQPVDEYTLCILLYHTEHDTQIA